MKSKNVLYGLSMAVVLQLGVLAGSAQTSIYLFTGSLTNITLPPGIYIIQAYGAEAAAATAASAKAESETRRAPNLSSPRPRISLFWWAAVAVMARA
jgi:hypothetical protein